MIIHPHLHRLHPVDLRLYHFEFELCLFCWLDCWLCRFVNRGCCGIVRFEQLRNKKLSEEHIELVTVFSPIRFWILREFLLYELLNELALLVNCFILCGLPQAR